MARILLVEDDPVQIEIIKKHLEPLGYVVIVAKNGQDGIAAAQENKPDLILMDMIMPGMHGLEATIKLKENPATESIPIIALTIMSSPKFVQECYRAGIIGYIKKPYNPKILLEHVEKVVGKPEKITAKIMLIAGASRLATMIEMRLLRQGHEVKTFAGAKSAVNQLKNETPGAVFIDVSLPEKHISMVIEELRRLEETRGVPIVVFAPALNREELRRAADRWGAQYLITSAGELGDLLRQIKESGGS